jgi:putative ABC transport system permease protein
MFKNYIKIAFRNLRKNKIDSIISIGGLALGIACCILLVLFVRFEWSFDDFHKNTDRIFRVVTEREEPSGETDISSSAPYQLGPELKKSYPELANVTRVYKTEIQLDSKGDLIDQQAVYVDSSFFNVFSFELIKGAHETVLNSPDNIVLTERKAQQLFGTTDVIGETVGLRQSEEVRLYQVSGIAANPPANSSIDFELVLSFENVPYTLSAGIFRKMLPQRWDVGFGEVYVQLRQNASKEQLEAKFPPFVEAHYGENGEGRSHSLQPLSDMYLNPQISSQVTKASSPFYSWILAGIALVVLVIACINFMSLNLSRASGRAGEIGIRKAAGAQRAQLTVQFLGEALITCFLSLVLGLIISELALPFFSALVGKPIPYNLFSGPGLWIVLGGIVLASALLTGLYPAAVLSRKNTSASLKGSRTASKTPVFVKGLIVVQFSLCLAFLISALLMHRQMSFITQKDLGFEQENVVVINTGGDHSKGKDIYEIYGSEIRRLPQVQNVATTLTGYGNALLPARLEIQDDQVLGIELDMIDSNFLETLHIEVVDGRGFSDERTADLENGALVNRTFVQRMGWENPIGKEIPATVEKGEGKLQPTLLEGKKVIGVVHDYNYRSLYNTLEPLVLVHSQALGSGVGTIWVKIKGEQLSETIAALETTWNKVAPDETFNYSFLDDVIQKQYEEEKRWRSIVDISALFAIGLACFGLFGLVSLAAQRRTKEIGIRKVLGATMTNIVGLLSKDFLKLVVLGFIIAVPIAWYAMNQWLADFAYKIEIGPGIFLLAGGLALLIALATVSWQSIRAALANPVDSLRSE